MYIGNILCFSVIWLSHAIQEFDVPIYHQDLDVIHAHLDTKEVMAYRVSD